MHMKPLKKRVVTTTALILMFAMTLTLVVLPTASAAEMNTFPIIGALPNPVGVGQPTLILTGLTKPTAWPQTGWAGVTVTMTKPDGTTQTLGPVTTDTTGMTGISYTPTQIGTHYLQTNFPEQVLDVPIIGVFGAVQIPAGTVMKASQS